MRDLTVDPSGVFSQTLAVPAGRWQITVTASATGVAPLSVTRIVSVRPVVVAPGITLVITAQKGNSWLRVIHDGVVLKVKEWGGPTLHKGESLTVTGVAEIYVRTGNAEALSITQNGQPVQITGIVGNWIFRPGLAPEKTSVRR
jgi:hypothetical protein